MTSWISCIIEKKIFNKTKSICDVINLQDSNSNHMKTELGIHISCFYSTTKHEILQISNHNGVIIQAKKMIKMVKNFDYDLLFWFLEF